MRNLFFCFFFFYSSSVLSFSDTSSLLASAGFEEDAVVGRTVRCFELTDALNEVQDYREYSLELVTREFYKTYLGPNIIQYDLRYGYDDDCTFLGWSYQTYRETEVASREYVPYYNVVAVYTPNEVYKPICEDGLPASEISKRSRHISGGGCCHSICVADFGWRAYEAGGCLPFTAAQDWDIYVLLYCKSRTGISQKTLVKKNNLISETNSKLGVISTAQSKINGILEKINKLFIPSSADTSFLNDDVDLIISPSISSSTSCPSGSSFSVLNHSYFFSYQPFCDFAVRVRPIVISSAQVVAAFLIMGSL